MLYPSIFPYIDHLSGNVYAPVVVVEYGDLLCQEVLGVQLLVSIRHFLPFNPHSISLDAAVACEVAGTQGIFWYNMI